MYLIVGASGMLGSKVARQLLAQGKAVRAMSRVPEKLDELRQLGAEVVQADLIEPQSLQAACAGIDKVLAAAHSVMGKGKYRSEAVDDVGHRALIDSARMAGVSHFVYTSAYGASPDHSIDFWRTKYGVEQYLLSRVPSFTILRPTAFMDFHAHILIGDPILKKGKVTLFGKGEALRNFVSADDVAEFALIALDDPNAAGEIIEIGGPENLTNKQVAEIYARLSGRPVKVSHVPLPVLRLMSVLMRPIHPGLSRAIKVSVYVDRHSEVFDPSETLRRYPLKLTRLEDWVKGRIVATKSPRVVPAEA